MIFCTDTTEQQSIVVILSKASGSKQKAIILYGIVMVHYVIVQQCHTLYCRALVNTVTLYSIVTHYFKRLSHMHCNVSGC